MLLAINRARPLTFRVPPMAMEALPLRSLGVCTSVPVGVREPLNDRTRVLRVAKVPDGVEDPSMCICIFLDSRPAEGRNPDWGR